MLSWVSLLPCFYCSWFYACFETTWVLFHSLPWLRQIIPNHLHLWSSALINRRGGQPVGGVGLGGTPRYISMLSVGGKCQGLCRFGVRCLCPDICTPCRLFWLSTLHNGDGCCLFVFFFFFLSFQTTCQTVCSYQIILHNPFLFFTVHVDSKSYMLVNWREHVGNFLLLLFNI